MYKLTNFQTVIRKADGANIPMLEENPHYVKYLQWVQSGGIPEPAETPQEVLAKEVLQAKADLIALDLASIRSIREWLVTQPSAPQILKDKENQAVLERAKVK